MDILSMWLTVTLAGRLYMFFLLSGVVYATIFNVRTLLYLHDLGGEETATRARGDSRLARLSVRLDNLQQLHLLLLSLSAMAVADEVLHTLRAILYSSMSLAGAGFEAFVPCAMFALFVFGVLTFLHVFQWIVASRLRKMAPSSCA